MAYEKYAPVWEDWRAARRRLRQLNVHPLDDLSSDEEAKSELRQGWRMLDSTNRQLRRHIAKEYRYSVRSTAWIGPDSAERMTTEEWPVFVEKTCRWHLNRYILTGFCFGVRFAYTVNLDAAHRHRVVEFHTLDAMVQHYPSYVFNTLSLSGVKDRVSDEVAEACLSMTISLTKAPRLKAGLADLFGNPHQGFQDILPDLARGARQLREGPYNYSNLFHNATRLLNTWVPATPISKRDVLSRPDVSSLSQGDTLQIAAPIDIQAQVENWAMLESVQRATEGYGEQERRLFAIALRDPDILSRYGGNIEIANKMDISPSHAGVLKHRLRKHLKQLKTEFET